MSLVSTDLAPINENLYHIRDHALKIEALQQSKIYSFDAFALELKSKLEDTVRSLEQINTTILECLIRDTGAIVRGIDKLDKTLNTLFGSKSGGLAAAIAPKAGVEQKKEDKNLSTVISSPTEQAKSAVVDESNEVPEFESPAIEKAINVMVDTQKNTNKLFEKFIKTEQKSKQSEKAKTLIKKPTENLVKKEKSDKKTKSKSLFNFKQFMSGLGGILRDIFNPVAMIIAFIQKSLPYILIAIAIFQGFWEGIGEELREKFTEIGKKIAIDAGIIFLAFKAGPILIRALALIFHGLRILYLNIEHAMKMALMKKELVHETITFTEERSLNVFKRMKEMITFILEKIFIAFKYVLEFAKFLLAAGIAIVIVGLVVLLIVGIIAALVLFATLFIAAIASIVLIFAALGAMILAIFLAIPTLIIVAVLSLFAGIFKWIFGGKSPDQAQNGGEVSSESKATEITFSQELKQAFNDAISLITTPLNNIKNAVNSIASNIESQSLVNGGEMSPAIRTVATTIVETLIEKQNAAFVTAIDRLAPVSNSYNTISDASGFDSMKKDVSDMKKSMDDLYQLMNKWHGEKGGNKFSLVPDIGKK